MKSMVTGPKVHRTLRLLLRWFVTLGVVSATRLTFVASSSPPASPVGSVAGVAPNMRNSATSTTMSAFLNGGVQSFTIAAPNTGVSGGRSQSPLVAQVAQAALTL